MRRALYGEVCPSGEYGVPRAHTHFSPLCPHPLHPVEFGVHITSVKDSIPAVGMYMLHARRHKHVSPLSVRSAEDNGKD